MDVFGISPAQLTIIIGLILLSVETLLLGLSTIVLLAVGIAAIITGGLAWAGILPETFLSLVSATGIGAGIITALLWKPLKRLQQSKVEASNVHSDFMGLTFTLSSTLSAQDTPVYVKHSGIQWQLLLDPASHDQVIPAGSTVKVVSVAVGKFTVQAC
ncbi:NfeD family protein [Photobacterium sanguinicancri]|uniref:Activity regulator of membrane protease YbbK n=1 Tax=Photobacterium sanguinicancri TaxID=875932 RepID=A0AAW7Y273_9GAMM|nr:activity regulator of membrane protease YbbK [Photobacterium sanguinicancri]MDO6496676.1 activity regulator of membrane protease YbbK [Photobacterium sanguinicancri]MDO6542407.1 activity regulator of membrane protease YbbK [Photobacterium sanguinicancri]